MADIILNGVTKSFEQDRVILDNVSLTVESGEKVGLLGGNGAGKTTLLRLITGELEPDRGSVIVARSRRIGYVEQMNTRASGRSVQAVLEEAFSDVIEAGQALDDMHRDMTGVSAYRYDETLRRFEARGGYEWRSELARVANGLGIGPAMRAQDFDTLSGGEQTRVRLARMILEEPDILLLDEPTNHLDVDSLEWLEEYLKKYEGTVLVISHDRYFLDTAVERIIELDRGHVEFYSGNYTYYAAEREVRRARQQLQYEQEQAKKKQLEFQIARLMAWSNVYDNPALAKRARAMERRIERTVQTEKPSEDIRLSASFASQAFRADRVLECRGITKAFDGKTLFGPIDSVITGRGESVALVGANGSGKTTLLKILLGELAPDSGEVILGPQVRLAYLPQQVEFSHPERTLYDTLLYETSCTPQEANDRLGAFRFSGEDRFKTVSQLSGGEKKRLMLCIMMMSKSNLLVLDEPTNHLDLASREWIEEAIAEYEGTLLFVSHDRYFIRRFANRVWELDHGFTDYPNSDYDRYRRVKALNTAAREAAREAEKPRAEKKEPPKKPEEKKPAQQSPRNARRQNSIERDINRLETELASFDARMEEAATDYVSLQELEKEKRELEDRIQALYEEWESLG